MELHGELKVQGAFIFHSVIRRRAVACRLAATHGVLSMSLPRVDARMAAASLLDDTHSIRTRTVGKADIVVGGCLLQLLQPPVAA